MLLGRCHVACPHSPVRARRAATGCSVRRTSPPPLAHAMPMPRSAAMERKRNSLTTACAHHKRFPGLLPRATPSRRRPPWLPREQPNSQDSIRRPRTTSLQFLPPAAPQPPSSHSPPPLVVPEPPRRGQLKNCRPPIPGALEIRLTSDDALPATLLANKWHKSNHRELLVPMLPSAAWFSLVSAGVPAVAVSHAPPSMAPLCRVRFSEEEWGKVSPWTEGSGPG
jgi:hypothetical protein